MIHCLDKTYIELLLVPVLYALFVLDLKLVAWETTVEQNSEVIMSKEPRK